MSRTIVNGAAAINNDAMSTDPTTPPASVPPQSQSPATAAPKRRGGIGRIIKWVVLIVIVLVVAAVAIVYFNLNGIVRRTVETQASSSLDLKTTLGSARVNLFGGSLNLGDLSIASPPGYRAPSMLSLNDAGVKVSLGELRGDPVHVRQITLDSPRIVLEANGTKLNVQAITDRQSKTPPSPTDSSKPSEPLKLIIDQLTVTNAQVALRPGVSIPGVKEEYALTLPPMTLEKIGTGEGNQNGVAIKEVVVTVLTAVVAKAAESDQLPPELKQLLSMNVDQLKARVGAEVQKQLQNVTKDLEKKLPGDVGKPVGDVLKDKDGGKALEKGVQDILGGGKKKDSTTKGQ
jgi:hypothetical protein